MKFLRIMILAILVPASSLLQAEIFKSGLQTVYEKIFGSEPVFAQYAALFYGALAEFGVKDAEQVPLRKMNKNAEKIIGNALLSFTLTGIWIDESALSELSDDEQAFMIYHESAHYALNHHARALGVLLLASPLIITIPYLYQAVMKNLLFTFVATAATWYGGYQLGLKSLIKKQEQEADRQATRLLIFQGRSATVSVYADSLYQLIMQGYGNVDDEWHNTLFERYENIVGCLETYKDKSLVKVLPLFI